MKNTIAILFIVIAFTSCNNLRPKNYYVCKGTTQGTFFNVTYKHDSELCLDIDSLLQEFSKSLSNYDSNSLISRINCNDTAVLDEYFVQMYNASLEVYEKTNGAFDITLAPIVNEWGFGWEKQDSSFVVDTIQLVELLQYVGMDKISIENDMLVKSNQNVTIIGNGVAQGLSVDVVSEFLISKGIDDFLVEIGGELYATGLNPNSDPWAVGVDKPIMDSNIENRETQIILNFSDWATATSGNYRKHLEIGNKSYGHSIDPRTGFPAVNSLLSVTVMAKSCVMADAYATAFMVLGLDESVSIVEKDDNLEAFFIYVDNNGDITTFQSSGFQSFIKK